MWPRSRSWKKNSFRYFTPAVICYQPYTLKAGQSLPLRYRIIVHSGRWGADALRKAGSNRPL